MMIGNKKISAAAILLAIFLVIAWPIILACNFKIAGAQQFSELARSFSHLKLYFLDNSPYNQYLADNVFYNNHYFWPLGPLPALILAPLAAAAAIFHFYFYQGYLNFAAAVLVFWLVFKTARKKYEGIDSWYLAAAFVFASMFLGVAALSSSWFLAQTIATTLLFWAIYEWQNKKRYLLIGAIFAGVLLTRLTAALGIIFFLLEIIFSENPENSDWRKNWRKKIKDLARLLLPVLAGFLLLLSYNYLRFNDFRETGYARQILEGAILADRQYGLMSLKHLPGNIYYALINMPLALAENGSRVLKFPFVKADPWGMSIFLTSPYLLGLFFWKYRDRRAKFLLATIVAIFLAVGLYYGIGYKQFGYRYALDFMPFLFFLFMEKYRERNIHLSNGLKFLIIASGAVNFYLFFTLLYVK